MTTVSEIAPEGFRISAFVPDFNVLFNQFVVRDDEPLLFHAGRDVCCGAGRCASGSSLRLRYRWEVCYEAERLTDVDTEGFDAAKLNKSFRRVCIPCS